MLSRIHEKKKVGLILGTLAVLTILVWHEWRNEDPVYKMKPAEFGTTEEFEEECWDAENKTVTADHIEKTGVLTELEPMQLERGTYQFMVSYNADSEDSYVEISSDMEMDEEGNVGKVYAREQISSDKEGVLLQVTIPEDAVGVTLKVYYGGGYLKVNQIEIRSMKQYTDTPIIYVLSLIFVWGVWLTFRKKGTTAEKAIVAVLVLEFIYVSTPLWNDFMVLGQDTLVHLGRIRGIYYSFRDGCFPMWINAFQGKGYGYASSIMYPQLFLWIPAVLMCLGMSLLNAYKLLLLMLNMAGVLIAYFSFKSMLKDRWAGVLAGMFYCMSLYRLGTVYTRGALGESLAMTFLPLFAAGLYEVVIGNYHKWIKLALGATGVLSSHILSSYLYVLCGAAFVAAILGWIIRHEWKKRFLAALKAIGTTILLNLYFLVPFLAYYNENFAISTEKNMASTMQAHGVYFSQMFATFVADNGGASLALGTTGGEMPLSVGGICLLVLICSGIKLWLRHGKGPVICSAEKENRICTTSEQMQGICDSQPTIAVIWIMTVLLLVASSWLFPWQIVEKIPVLNKLTTMQFPWRLFAPATFCCALLMGDLYRTVLKINEQGGIRNTRRLNKSGVVIIAALLITANSLYYMDSLQNLKTVATKTMADTKGSTDALYLYDESSCGIWDKGQVVTSDDELTVRNYSHRGNRATFAYEVETTMAEEILITVPLYYYPNYHVYVNGEDVAVRTTSDGRICFATSEMSGDVEICYEAPSTWYVAYVVSLITALAGIVRGIRSKR